MQLALCLAFWTDQSVKAAQEQGTSLHPLKNIPPCVQKGKRHLNDSIALSNSDSSLSSVPVLPWTLRLGVGIVLLSPDLPTLAVVTRSIPSLAKTQRYPGGSRDKFACIQKRTKLAQLLGGCWRGSRS